jgi:NADH-quinone oxidoreductase subunit N
MPIQAAALDIDLGHLAPELILGGFALFVILIDLVVRDKTVLAWASGGGVILAALATVLLWTGGVSGTSFSNVVVVDAFGLFFKLLILGGTFLVILASPDYVRRFSRFQGEYYGLILLAAMGMTMIASLGELISIYLALEVQTFALIALTTFLKSARSMESGLKFLLVSAVSTAIMLYGLALLFGLTGSTFLSEIAAGVADIVSTGGAGEDLALVLAAVLLLVGFGFKVSSVPFQMWVPDVYEGSPTTIAAYLSVASKAAGFAVLLRVFLAVFGQEGLDWLDWQTLIGVLAVLSMTIGNIVAIAQTNLKRLLGYSTIAHAGYIMVGVAALNSAAPGAYETAVSGVLFYLAAYTVTNLGAFIAIIALTDRAGGEQVSNLSGLGPRAPFLAFVLTLSLISLTGLPPTGLFIGKVYLFYGAFQSGLWWLALAGVINSFVSAYYYLRPVRAMYVGAPQQAAVAHSDTVPVETAPAPRPSLALRASLALAMAGVLLLGVVPPWLIERATEAARTLELGG